MNPGTWRRKCMSVQLKTIVKKSRNRFTASQKLAILQEWQACGNGVELSQRYGIHPMTLYRWKKRLELGAAEFLKGTRSKPEPQLKALEMDNQKLKDTVTLLSQELMLLKKKMNLV